MGFSFNRQSLSYRRAGTPGVVPQGSIVLSATALVASATAGDAAFELDDAIALMDGGPGVISNPAVAIAYSGATDWLSLSVAVIAGVVVYQPTVDPSLLSAATEVATLTFTADNASNSGLTATITLTVDEAIPSIDISPTSLSLSLVDETASGAPGTATISNAGSGTMATPTVGTITGAGAAYIATADITGTGPWTLTVTPTATGGTPGQYVAQIPILSAGASNTPLSFAVTITVTSAGVAVIRIDRSLDDATGTVGAASPAPITVGVTSANPLVPLAGPFVRSVAYIGNFGGWLTATFGGPTGSALTGTPDTSAITTDGSARAIVTVGDANAIADDTWEFVLRMGAAPASAVMTVTPTSISRPVVTGETGGTATLLITNGGAGGLAALGVLSAAFASPPAWVASVSVNASTGEVTITFAADNESAGTQAATLVVSASLATNSPRNVPVQIVVADPTGSYPAPRNVLPSWATFNASTNLIEDEPFATPALGGFS